MTKSELIVAIADKCDLSKQLADRAVDLVFDDLSRALARGERTEIRGFGVFEPRARQPRGARNPSTGERVEVEAKTAVHFKPGKSLCERVDY
ncbi:HU family DNA-binding protein [Magnetococcus sp. PR-3]|uniref:HU family DNA-binding protein n=1 Tax=Magnetococcus sp. PR-3 TaxID=3120355 RepID=UPI002FCDF8C1